MNQVTLYAMRDALRSHLTTLDTITVSCQSCQHFNPPRCKLADAVPPADVIKVGCDSWAFDGVPF